MSFVAKLVQAVIALVVAVVLIIQMAPAWELPWKQGTGEHASLDAALLTSKDLTGEYAYDSVRHTMRHGDAGGYVDFEARIPSDIYDTQCLSNAPYFFTAADTTARSTVAFTDLPQDFVVAPEAPEDLKPYITIEVNDARNAAQDYDQEMITMIQSCANQGNLGAAAGKTITAEWHDDLRVLTYYHQLPDSIVPLSVAVRTDTCGSTYVAGMNVPEELVADVADLQIHQLSQRSYAEPDFSTPVPGLAQLLGTYLYWNWF